MARTARPVAWTVLASPFGPIHVAVDGDAVVALELRSTDAAFLHGIQRRLRPFAVMRWGGAAADGADDAVGGGTLDTLGRSIAQVERSIDAYLAGDRDALALPVTLVGLSAWDVRVLEAVREIPFGSVSSYGRVARRMGARGAARAVGGAVGRNPVGLLIPCHRVIAGDGTLGGYGGAWWGGRSDALELKRALLTHEHVALPALDLLRADDGRLPPDRTLPPMREIDRLP